MRGLGVTEALAALPSSVVFLFVVVTQLGDAWFIFTAFAMLHWRGNDRLSDRFESVGATLIGLSLCSFALTVGLKAAFHLPRPANVGPITPPTWLPGAVHRVYVDVATSSGFGFPSGHAVATTVAYFGLAALLDVSTRRRRLTAAAAVVTVVGFSRLVLGAHYLVDVVAGVVVGLAVLAVLVRVAPSPSRTFGVAATLGVIAVGAAAAGGYPDSMFEAGLTFGAATGGLVGWRGTRAAAARPSWPAVVAGVFAVGGLWVVALYGGLGVPAATALAALAVGFAIALPSLVGTDGDEKRDEKRMSTQNVSR